MTFIPADIFSSNSWTKILHGVLSNRQCARTIRGKHILQTADLATDYFPTWIVRMQKWAISLLSSSHAAIFLLYSASACQEVFSRWQGVRHAHRTEGFWSHHQC